MVAPSAGGVAIQIGNQMGATVQMVLNHLDERACSGGLGTTHKTVWISQTGLRSRWRRFESCRGCPFRPALLSSSSSVVSEGTPGQSRARSSLRAGRE